MKISVEVELKPFNVPNYVLTVVAPRPRQEGIQESPKYRLSELDPIVLDRLCNEFRREVFSKAEKDMPAKEQP